MRGPTGDNGPMDEWLPSNRALALRSGLGSGRENLSILREKCRDQPL
jgi:hypothetical protein